MESILEWVAKPDVFWVAMLWVLGIALLFKVMKRENNLANATYEGLSTIAALLTFIAVMLYYIYQKL